VATAGRPGDGLGGLERRNAPSRRADYRPEFSLIAAPSHDVAIAAIYSDAGTIDPSDFVSEQQVSRGQVEDSISPLVAAAFDLDHDSL
jgi:hypothetical protein